MQRMWHGITQWQVVMLLASSLAIAGHVMVTPQLIDSAGRDVWLAVLVAWVPGLIGLLALIQLLNRFQGHSLVQILPRVLGRFPGKILAGIYLLALTSAAAVTVRIMADWLISSFLPYTPQWAIVIPYLLIAWYVTMAGLVPIVRVNQYILPIVMLMGILVGLATLPNKEYAQLLPVLEYGWPPVLEGALMVCGIFGQFLFLGFLAPHVQLKLRRRVILTAFLFVGIIMMGPATASVAQWGLQTAIQQVYPAFTSWQMISLARIVERVDLLVIHQWVAGGFPRTAFLIHAIAEGGAQLAGDKRTPMAVTLATILVAGASYALFPNRMQLDWYLHQIHYPALAFLGLAVPVILLALVSLQDRLGRPARGVAQP